VRHAQALGCSRITPEWCLRRLYRALTRKGRLRWHRLFGCDESKPVKLEIASGTGDWVVAQALADGGANWVAFELKHDRVASIFSRMAMRRVTNLAVIGGDAALCVQHHVKPASVVHVFINFPEPPHRSGDEEASSEHHLLTLDFFRHLHQILVASGRITVFSDNGRYCQSLARTVAALRDTSSGARLLKSEVVPECTSFERVEGVHVYHGTPGRRCGHLVSEQSYFDRFWNAGQHSERFFLMLVKG